MNQSLKTIYRLEVDFPTAVRMVRCGQQVDVEVIPDSPLPDKHETDGLVSMAGNCWHVSVEGLSDMLMQATGKPAHLRVLTLTN